MQKILLLGASGLVGKALIDEWNDDFDIYGTYSSTSTNLLRKNSSHYTNTK